MVLANALVRMKGAKLKGFTIRDVETAQVDKEERSVLNLQPLPKIDPKDKGKAVLEEEPEPEKKKMKPKTQIELDAEVAQQFHLEEIAEMERLQKERELQEQASQEAIAKLYDEVQSRMDADQELPVRWSKEEQENYLKTKELNCLVSILKTERSF